MKPALTVEQACECGAFDRNSAAAAGAYPHHHAFTCPALRFLVPPHIRDLDELRAYCRESRLREASA